MRKKLKVPKFKNDDQERDFWSNLDLSKYYDSKDFKKISFPNLKPSTKTISLRLPQYMLDDLKIIANKIDVPYQSYIKVILNERLQKEKQKLKTKSK